MTMTTNYPTKGKRGGYKRAEACDAGERTCPVREWSSYQAALFTWIEARNAGVAGPQHAILAAVAGSGKSTTVERAFWSIPKDQSVACFAFNRDTANAMAKRAPKHIRVQTLSAFGRACLQNAWGLNHKNFEGSSGKGANGFFYQVPPERQTGAKQKGFAKAIVGDKWRDIDCLVKASTLSRETRAIDAADPIAAIQAMIVEYDLDIPAEMPESTFIAAIIRHVQDCRNHRSLIDFCDMIDLAVHYNLVESFDWVFIDECQDLNALQIAMVKLACKKGGHVIAVGDTRQAIYRFRGADKNAMGNLVQSLGAETLPLSVSYRCARAIVGEAQATVAAIQAAPGAPEGTVDTLDAGAMASNAGPGSLVLSRINAPLFSACLAFAAQNRPAYILGKKDMAKGLVEKVEWYESVAKKSGIPATVEGFTEWHEAIIEGKVEKRLKAKRPISDLVDMLECFEILAEDCQNTNQMKDRIDYLFTEKKDSIALSTVHQAKGKEYDRVFILTETFEKVKRHPNVDKEEESNIWYVAVTRAKNHLTYLSGSLPDKEGSEGAEEDEAEENEGELREGGARR